MRKLQEEILVLESLPIFVERWSWSEITGLEREEKNGWVRSWFAMSRDVPHEERNLKRRLSDFGTGCSLLERRAEDQESSRREERWSEIRAHHENRILD